MTLQDPSFHPSNWQQQAEQYCLQQNYAQAAVLYEQAIEIEPEVKSHYLNLGLLLLLQGQETEAQTVWLFGMADGEPEQIEQWSLELYQLLQAEAEHQESLEQRTMAWTIRQHMREVAPFDLNNLLKTVQLSLQLKTFSAEDLVEQGIIELFQSASPEEIDSTLLLQTLEALLTHAYFEPHVLELIEISASLVQPPLAFINLLIKSAMYVGHMAIRPDIAAQILEIARNLSPKHPEVLKQLAIFYQNSRQFEQGIETARQAYSQSQNLPEKIYTNYLLLRGLRNAGGYWEETLKVFQHQLDLSQALVSENPTSLPAIDVSRLITPLFFQPCFRDGLAENRQLHNQVMQVCQNNIERYAATPIARYRQRHGDRSRHNQSRTRLKIGYISHCLKSHSVGWLSRWLIQHHNHDQFEVHGYFVGSSSDYVDPLQEWFIKEVDYAHTLESDSVEIAEQIFQDEIDILIDLDSITLDTTTEVMAMKPAPVQATWLGWDASGVPAVDYFIVDPYVLPEQAEAYYTEKLWRLPQTYIAVDGFEVGVPSLRRDQLDIPVDAVTFLSAQRGQKRHADTTRMQMQIIKSVPNSYFLIKGVADADAIQEFFTQIAEEEGVDPSRLKFLPQASSESVHRANLEIADVVLDTYPYNGATTTLETLWMGIPLVTRVGEHFSSRNSYTMMVNAGITAGIAWTDKEYIEWGIRLGTDANLRREIHWKLLQSRRTAPLWNAKKFTRQMEEAYQQMWQIYCTQ